MKRPVVSLHAAWLLVWLGLSWMCSALFLHPMSPENFIDTALRSPWAMLSREPGATMAAWFWFSLALCVAGVLGLTGRRRNFDGST